jgi:hypothetical protein
MGPITMVVIHDIGCGRRNDHRSGSTCIQWHMCSCKGITGRWSVNVLGSIAGLVLRTDENIGICGNLPISTMARVG